jgi:predicted ATPase/DNA-binding SARP family transcriptional activator
MDVRYSLLGPMEVRVDGVAAKLPGTAERALLAQLLLSPGRTIPATMLVDRLWSDSTLPIDPMNALQIRVSKLRRAVKAMGVGEVVVREGVGYRATIEPSAVDAIDFAERIRAARAAAAEAADDGGVHPAHLQAYDDALALWRSEPLSDFAVEQWATAEAARLTQLRLAAMTERAQVALALGRHAEVIADLEPVVADDPTLESLAGLLMLALYRSGRQADALDVYTRTREVLDDSLGLEPSVSLRSLHERVLRQDTTLGAQQDMVPAAAASSTSTGANSPAQPATGLVTMPAHRSRADEDRTAPTNLPTVVRPLIGRDDQLDSIAELLGGVRLLTLIGPGGAGKTSLALATVVRTAARYPDGAFGVRLASVSAADQVPVAVADALGMPLDGAMASRDLRDRLASFLARRRMLLLIDNCEHVVDAAAALMDDILSRCPGITLIATSREALAVPDEVQVTVGPLPTPPEDAPPGEVLRYPAAQLFAERARAVRPGLLFGADNLRAIGAITRSLDGIPLALELAAARVSTLSPVEVSARLADRFTLLTSGARTAEERQQTLRATVDWSYQLLSEAERRVFDRLSVFQGGWTLMSAEEVVGEDASPGEVLDTIARLVEQSMIVVETGPTSRYRMLETLRQYAAERLHSSGQAVDMARRHAAYFRSIVEHAEVALRGHEQRQTLELLHDEQPNIRAALAFLSGSEGDRDAALMMAGSLGMFWHLGRHLEGRQVLSRLVADHAGSPAARALALQAVSIVERPRGCLVHPSSRCAETAAESLALFEQLGDAWHAAMSRVLLAVEGVTGAEPERSQALLAAAEEQFARDGDPWGPAVIGFVRMETAVKAGGDVDTAVRIGRTTAAAFRDLDDAWGLSATLYHLGWGYRQFGRFDEAARALEEAIDVSRGAGLWNTAQWAMADLAITKVHVGGRDTARKLFDEAASASREIGDGAGEVLAGYGYGLHAHVDRDSEQATA